MDLSRVVQPSMTPGRRLKAFAQFGTEPNRPRTCSYISRTGPSASDGVVVRTKAMSSSCHCCGESSHGSARSRLSVIASPGPAPKPSMEIAKLWTRSFATELRSVQQQRDEPDKPSVRAHRNLHRGRREEREPRGPVRRED